MSEDKRSITVQIENITEAQAIALETLFAQWVTLGKIGASRWTALFADGDGNFRPRVLVNGRPATASDLPLDVWKGAEFRIDPDQVACRMAAQARAYAGGYPQSRSQAKRLEIQGAPDLERRRS